MFTFVFSPRANRETLREFNERVKEFCAENPVVSLEASTVGENLVIQGITAEDTDASGVPTYTATVRTLDPTAQDMEEQLDGLIDQERARHAINEDGDPNLPIKMLFATGEKRSWVVVLCINGIAEDDDGKDGGDDGGDDSAPEPTPAPAAGFQGG